MNLMTPCTYQMRGELLVAGSQVGVLEGDMLGPEVGPRLGAVVGDTVLATFTPTETSV